MNSGGNQLEATMLCGQENIYIHHLFGDVKVETKQQMWCFLACGIVFFILVTNHCSI